MEELLNALFKMKPYTNDGFELLRQLSEGTFGTADLIANGQAIGAAAGEIEDFASMSEGIVKRCLAMEATVSNKVPIGF